MVSGLSQNLLREAEGVGTGDCRREAPWPRHEADLQNPPWEQKRKKKDIVWYGKQWREENKKGNGTLEHQATGSAPGYRKKFFP